MIDGIVKVGMLKQILCRKVASLVSDCILEIDTFSKWGTPPLPSTVK